MFAQFDCTNFPYIKVKLNRTIESDLDYYSFINKWDSFNERKQPYYFIFDTIDVGFINFKYSILMTHFISKLKNKTQYLKGSIIIIGSEYIRYLLKFIFMMQKPVAEVYIIEDMQLTKIILAALIQNTEIDMDGITLIKPNKKII